MYTYDIIDDVGRTKLTKYTSKGDKHMKKFEVGNRYYAKSVCNSDCEWVYTVIKRTAKTVTLEDEKGNIKRFFISSLISGIRNAESVMPEGNYSMCPILSADHMK